MNKDKDKVRTKKEINLTGRKTESKNEKIHDGEAHRNPIT